MPAADSAGHDRTVSAKLDLFDHQLEIARVAGGAEDAAAELFDRGHRPEAIEIVPLVDDGDDFVDKSIPADQHTEPRDRRPARPAVSRRFGQRFVGR